MAYGTTRRLLLGVLLATVLLLGWPWLWDAALSSLLLSEVLHPVGTGPLSRLTAPPGREAVTFPGGGRSMEATLYRPGTQRGKVGVVLVHGVNEAGKDDPRIVRLADELARVGFVVLTPDFLGFKSLTLRSTDVEELVASVQYLSQRLAAARRSQIGLIGFSYGAGPTLIAAADPRIRDRVRFVVSFGGYYDLMDVITFVTTGAYQFGSIHGQVVPDPYVRWIFLRYILQLLPTARDRRILQAIAEAKAKDPAVVTDAQVSALGPEGRAAYDLWRNRDPARTPQLLRSLGPDVRAEIWFLSPARVIGDLRARLFIVHSDPDSYIPPTESLRLASALSARGNVHLAILRTFAHVRPNFPALTPDSFVRTYVPEGAKLFWLVFDLVRQRRDG